MGYYISVKEIYERKDNSKWLTESFRNNKIIEVLFSDYVNTPKSASEMFFNVLNIVMTEPSNRKEQSTAKLDALYNSKYNVVKGNTKVLYKSLDDITAESSRKKAKPICEGLYYAHTNENSEITIIKTCAALSSIFDTSLYLIEFIRKPSNEFKDESEIESYVLSNEICSCYNCGAELLRKDEFCSKCGAEQTGEKPIYKDNSRDLNWESEDPYGDKRYEEDDDPAKEVIVTNKIGNDPANVCKEMELTAAKQGNMVYLLKKYGGIYKMQEDDNKLKKVYSGNNISLLNVAGQWLYFIENLTIYKVKLNGKEKKEIFNLEKYTGTNSCSFESLITIGDLLFFSIISWDENITPFVASIGIDGTGLMRLYTLDRRYSCDDNNIKILSAGTKYLYCEIYAEEGFKLLLNTDGSKHRRLYECYDYKKILNSYPDEDTTEESIRIDFEDSIEYIDFIEGWIYFRICNKENYSLYKMKINGSQLQPAWREANWSEHNLNDYYCGNYYFNGKVNVGFSYGGGHYYTLFRCYPDGKVINLHGNGSGGGIEDLNVAGSYAYWANRRLDLNTGIEEEIDFVKLIVQRVND